jgi:hypothetical protein
MSPRRPLLVNADDLEQWSDRYDAAAKLPLLVRRLEIEVFDHAGQSDLACLRTHWALRVPFGHATTQRVSKAPTPGISNISAQRCSTVLNMARLNPERVAFDSGLQLLTTVGAQQSKGRTKEAAEQRQATRYYWTLCRGGSGMDRIRDIRSTSRLILPIVIVLRRGMLT